MTDSKDRKFKKLTPKNWLERDHTIDAFVRLVDSKPRRMTETDWAEDILSPELSPSVPRDVQDLFEVARGVLCYGCFFYPLYSLGSEQLFRVHEAAFRHVARQLGAPPSLKRYTDLLDWARQQGLMSDERFYQWDAARRLRNAYSHAEQQSLITPPNAAGQVALCALLINELFDCPLGSCPGTPI